jgi:hypothetical protein
MSHDERDREPEAPAATAPRKPYEPPRIVSEEVFETLALACGKASGSLVCTWSNRS